MSNTYSGVEDILQMLERDHSYRDVEQALADLEAMSDYISEYKYENVKKLLEDTLAYEKK